MYGCDNEEKRLIVKEGPFNLYYEDEFIGKVDYVKESGALVCVVSNLDGYPYDYHCWEKDDIIYIKVEEDD